MAFLSPFSSIITVFECSVSAWGQLFFYNDFTPHDRCAPVLHYRSESFCFLLSLMFVRVYRDCKHFFFVYRCYVWHSSGLLVPLSLFLCFCLRVYMFFGFVIYKYIYIMYTLSECFVYIYTNIHIYSLGIFGWFSIISVFVWFCLDRSASVLVLVLTLSALRFHFLCKKLVWCVAAFWQRAEKVAFR